MVNVIIAKFKLNEGQEAAWAELSAQIQAGMSQAPGFISRDTGADAEGNNYCVVRFETKEQREASMKQAMEKAPESFEAFGKAVDMSTMEKMEFDVA
jgi:antibiotic biosynthesis monooxygenase (ABM) superfamily enzyme